MSAMLMSRPAEQAPAISRTQNDAQITNSASPPVVSSGQH
jgi:hypothetical protein